MDRSRNSVYSLSLLVVQILPAGLGTEKLDSSSLKESYATGSIQFTHGDQYVTSDGGEGQIKRLR